MRHYSDISLTFKVTNGGIVFNKDEFKARVSLSIKEIIKSELQNLRDSEKFEAAGFMAMYVTSIDLEAHKKQALRDAYFEHLINSTGIEAQLKVLEEFKKLEESHD